ncbi:hypothetical protein J4453_00810 [Candidatus Woesearchaeota archaeon]|nr:hypothetical protein [Candidatus Woesearchaeota archaeon]
MKKPSCALRFGNKGFVFTLDVAIAVFILVGILAISSFYISRTNEESLSRIQMERTGSDILALVDYNGALESLSTDTLRTSLNVLLPANYHARIEISGGSLEGAIVTETSLLPFQNEFIVTAERSFLKDGQFYKAKIYVWLK